jgi:hypothetical protein
MSNVRPLGMHSHFVREGCDGGFSLLERLQDLRPFMMPGNALGTLFDISTKKISGTP